MDVIKNTTIIKNFTKFNKMSLINFELNEIKYRKELLFNYDYIHAIKSGDISMFEKEEDVIKVRKLADYFFGTIPLRKQKVLLLASKGTRLKLPHEDCLDVYVCYLNARISAYQKLGLT